MSKYSLVRFLGSLLIALICCGLAKAQSSDENFAALVFSKTLLYRHASITNGITAIRELGEKNHFQVDATEDSSWFTPSRLAKYKVIVFLSTSGEIFNEDQKTAFREYLEHGGGLAAIHAAVAGDLATEGGWSWYADLLCAKFANHSSVTQATVRIEDNRDPSTMLLPEAWVRSDEWYNFLANPRAKAHVLARVDEETYKGGTMGKDHPIAWCCRIGKGRMWYTALGHTEASFSEPLFLNHLLGGIQVAAGVRSAKFTP